MIPRAEAAAGMLSFNRTERRSLATATGLVVLGSAIRLGLGPSAADTAWRRANGSGVDTVSITGLRSAVQQGIDAETRAGTPLADGERIDPNFADAAELRRLPGVGPTRAAAIILDRRENGPYRALEDLERVVGLGPATVARLAPHLALVPGATAVPSTDTKLDLNRAGTAELIELPGIGPELAERIVALRRRNGNLQAVDDLLEVPGIGPVTLEKIRNRVRIR